MYRYFLELSYLGTQYAGFQVQPNARTVQSEVEAALRIYFRQEIKLTGSSRTDAGVHALQNYFHFDSAEAIGAGCLYNLNALLPADIVLKKLVPVGSSAHARFDALSREYEYKIYASKDPFLKGRAYYYPYALEKEQLDEAARLVRSTSNFATFSKRRSQAKTTICTIMESEWRADGPLLVYRVKANRFLRGMVRGLVGTMLWVGRKKMDMIDFHKVIKSGLPAEADFSVPGEGLYLNKVSFPQEMGL
jgi:tRNA pseudouridine38-40 synthase